MALTAELEGIASEVVDSAFKIHTALGPGLLESVYDRCLRHEMGKRGLRFVPQVSIPIQYDGVVVEGGLRIDLIVEDALIVEVKSVDRLLPVFTAQLLTYLKLTDRRLGLLINFNVPLIREGIRRVIR